ncbi:MAG: HD domain-containing protein [Anaeromyxobacteraceae bacterium]
MNEPATNHAALVQRLVIDLGGAFQKRTAYSPGHPQVEAAVARVLEALAALCSHAGNVEVSLLLLEGQLLVDRVAVPDDAPWARGVMRAFLRHGIRGMTLVAGLGAAELGRFFDGCMSAAGPSPSPHILLGQGGFSAGEEPRAAGAAGGGPTGGAPSIPFEQVEGARGELRAIGAGEATRIERLRGLVALLARGADGAAIDALRGAATRIDDREFLHGLAVALTTQRIARALQVDGKLLEELVLAALLHDVGYLEGGPAEGGTARRRRGHPVRGAARLAAIEGIPDVAVRVAGEHHLRFDGAPSYPPLSTPRVPVTAARLVAVADTWVGLRASCPMGTAEAIALLRARAGTFLDPAIVEVLAEVVGAGPPAGS